MIASSSDEQRRKSNNAFVRIKQVVTLRTVRFGSKINLIIGNVRTELNPKKFGSNAVPRKMEVRTEFVLRCPIFGYNPNKFDFEH